MFFYLFVFLGIFSLLGPSELFAEFNSGADVYMIKQQESLDTLATKLLPRFQVKYNQRKDDLKKDLREWNPHITNWDNIPLFTNIYIEYPYTIYFSHPYAPKLGQNFDVANADIETPAGDKRFTIHCMYTASSGNLEERVTSKEGNIKSTQNSPATLGLGTTVFFDENSKMVNSSFYWSSIRPSKLKGANESSTELKSISEYGANLYYQRSALLLDLSIYGGLDYEQFSTFNTASYINGDDLSFNKNNFLFGTIGLGRNFFWGDTKISLKGSFSQSLKSTTTSPDPTDKFTGKRLLFFTSIKGESRFTYHLLYKRHTLDGPSNLTINRIGVGLGFVIF